MRYPNRQIILRNGVYARLRSPGTEDAEAMLGYLRGCAAETEFIIRYPEECTETLEQERDFLQRMTDDENTLMIVCEVEGEIAGTCQLSLNRRVKVRHKASVGIAVRQQYWNLGIGTEMLSALVAVAREKNLMFLELEFIEGNERGRHLYEKMGFAVAAEKPNAIRLRDGSMRSEFYMMKML